MSAKLALSYMLIMLILFFGWLVGLDGMTQYEGGLVWIALVSGCPFMAGCLVTTIFHTGE
mgnify:CR=1 FL=1